jgi:uncharacterized protein (DUF111 family)
MNFGHRYEHTDNEMMLLQANLDDMNPEFCSHVAERLFSAGANDVYWVPLLMKKGRPGLMLNVLAHRDAMERMKEIVFRETTTLGVRYFPVECHRLGREFVSVDTPWGPVRIKKGIYRGEEVQIAPEHDDCARIAEASGVPLKTVYEAAKQAYWKQNRPDVRPDEG